MLKTDAGTEAFENPKGWLEVIWPKHLTLEEYMAAAQHLFNMLTRIEDQGGQPVILVDFSRMETITPDAAKVATGATKDMGAKKIAGVGIKPQFAAILDAIKKGSTRADTIRDFPTRAEAEAWLLEP